MFPFIIIAAIVGLVIAIYYEMTHTPNNKDF